MKIILKKDALKIDAEQHPKNIEFTKEHAFWREEVQLMVEEGGEFRVNTGMLYADRFIVFRKDDVSIEIPDYMIETVIDDVRQKQYVKVTLRKNALEIHAENKQEIKADETHDWNWSEAILDILQKDGESDIYDFHDNELYVLDECNCPVYIPLYMVESFTRDSGEVVFIENANP